MEEVNKAMTKMRDTLVNYLGDWLDPGYIILTRKSNPLSQEEKDFKQMYANTIALHCSNILLTIPATYCYGQYFLAQRRKDEAKMKIAKRRIMVFLPLCLATMITAYAYQKTNHFEARLKQIEQFYLTHQDINNVSFKHQYITNENTSQ